ncbi:MerR family transcriptional regulator [Candidatus Formimonas warabiya]|uniref:HTH merR-type domain-containing protein n=1 Tax=Formimonas warabiya TaxID=1761012 RepID=A0A3G1KVW4_FORW1|nr:MerR family transcriptional regulator [Candidatus Formimonas warabiya]ATW26571.1 hypothetical protein DCMF_19055 [Candidatus Formimonas warabiya]
MGKEHWKVGEISKLTGLSVRTLHHYHQIGLLIPSEKTGSGHRLYIKSDIALLQQILSLRALNFSLDEIKKLLSNPGFSPHEIIRLHLEKTREHIQLQEELCQKLEAVEKALEGQQKVSTEKFIKIIEVIVMSEKHQLTPEKIERLKRQGEILDQEKIKELGNEWLQMNAKDRAEMEKVLHGIIQEFQT